jgi:hypothetical protein
VNLEGIVVREGETRIDPFEIILDLEQHLMKCDQFFLVNTPASNQNIGSIMKYIFRRAPLPDSDHPDGQRALDNAPKFTGCDVL